MGYIAVVGKMRSVKNTVADMLVADYGYVDLAFADSIKELVAEFFPEALENGAIGILKNFVIYFAYFEYCVLISLIQPLCH